LTSLWLRGPLVAFLIPRTFWMENFSFFAKDLLQWFYGKEIFCVRQLWKSIQPKVRSRIIHSVFKDFKLISITWKINNVINVICKIMRIDYKSLVK
jgi:hypothetical protein